MINAGIEKVYIRDSQEEYRMIEVREWVEKDESLEGARGY